MFFISFNWIDKLRSKGSVSGNSDHLHTTILVNTAIPTTFRQIAWADTKNPRRPTACDRCTLPNHFSAVARCEVVFVVIMWFSVECSWYGCLRVFLVWVQSSNVLGMGAPPSTFPLVGNRFDQVLGHRPSILSHKPDGDMSIRASYPQYTFTGHVFNSATLVQSVFTATHLCLPCTLVPLLEFCIILKPLCTEQNHSRFCQYVSTLLVFQDKFKSLNIKIHPQNITV